MNATCKCGTCGLSWFRCNCPDMDTLQQPRENQWTFWRNMTRQDVEALMDREAKFLAVQHELERIKAKVFYEAWSL